MTDRKEAVHTDLAPRALGPYSQAIKHGDLVFLSGQVALDPETMQMAGADIETQANRIFRNIAAVVEASGTSMDRVLKLTIFLTDLKNFRTVNEIMKKYFSEPYPARSTVEISALPAGACIEIEAIASASR